MPRKPKEPEPERYTFEGIKENLSPEDRVNFDCGILIGEKIRDNFATLPVNEDVVIFALRYLGACALAMDTPPYPTKEQVLERQKVFADQVTAMSDDLHRALVSAFEKECPDVAKEEKEKAKKTKEPAE